MQSMQSTDFFGVLMYNLCYKLCFDVYKAGNGHEFRVSRSGIDVGYWP